MTLGALARETDTIRLGTMVASATFRHPGPLAISVAQVDEMSGGRVELGIGAGWFEKEHAAYAIPFPPLRERFDRLAEQLKILTGLWTTRPGRHDFAGGHYPVTDSPALPKPVQEPHPPIIIGGRAPSGPGAGRPVCRRVQRALLAAGHRHHAVPAGASGRRRGRAPRRLDDVLGLFRGLRRARRGRDNPPGRRHRPRPRRVAFHSPLVGTPTEIVDKLAVFGEAGVARVYLQLLDLADLDHLDLFAGEVARQLS